MLASMSALRTKVLWNFPLSGPGGGGGHETGMCFDVDTLFKIKII